jgi:hypothetical protein
VHVLALRRCQGATTNPVIKNHKLIIIIMKLFSFPFKSITTALAAGALALALAPKAQADPSEAADRAYEMAMRYSGMGYYMTPSKEGHGGFGVTLEFEIPVNRGLDYVFILAGDRFCEDVEVWVEAEETANTLVKDTRLKHNGLAGVRWRSDYNGSVTVVVHFARVTSRCGWSALVGRRGTPTSTYQPGGDVTTTPGSTQKLGGDKAPADAAKPGN